MAGIFISYRRADSRITAARIYDRLVSSLGKQAVFKDVDDIPLGTDFRDVLREAVFNCDVMLVIIGSDWLQIQDSSGARRLENPDDFVRLEVETALQSDKIRVIPVLIEGARMPAANELPVPLKQLAYLNAIQVRDDPDFHSDINRLVDNLKSIRGISRFNVDSSIAPTTWVLRGLSILIVILLTFGYRFIEIPQVIDLNPLLTLFVSILIFLPLSLRISTIDLVILALLLMLSVSSITGDFIFTSASIIVGFVINFAQIPHWLYKSGYLAFLRFKVMYVASNSDGNVHETHQDIASLIGALSLPSRFNPWGLQSTLRIIAETGMQVPSFENRASNPILYNAYSQSVYAVALKKLVNTTSLKDAAEISGLKVSGRNVIINLERSYIEISAERSVQGRLHLYSDLIEALLLVIRDIDNTLSESQAIEAKSITHLITLVHSECNADIIKYWDFRDQVQQLVDDQNAILDANSDINKATTSLRQRLRKIQPTRDLLLETDYEVYEEILSILANFIEVIPTNDYPQRIELIGSLKRRVSSLSKGFTNEITLINRENDIIHDSPLWSSIVKITESLLEKRSTLDEEFLESVVHQIGNILSNIQTIEDLSQIDDELQALSQQNSNYGEMIDDTLMRLLYIGQDVDAGLASLHGSYNRQLALQDAQLKINQLYNTLQTRYPHRSSLWCQALSQASIVIDEYLRVAETTISSGYKNPYIAGTPVQPKRAALFKGRIDLASQIVTKLRSGSHPTFVLYGPRRMGKTSFLLQLQNLLPANFVTAFCNMQNAGADQNDGSFFYYLARAIYKQIRRTHGGDLVPEPILTEYENHPYDVFSPWLEHHVIPCLENKMLFVGIDEFELIGHAVASGRLSSKVYANLRHIMQHYEQFILIFAGVQNLSALGPDSASYFIGAHAIEISYLDHQSATELIINPDPDAGTMPAYQSDVIDRVLYLTHRQPFLIQAVCSEIIDMANRDNLEEIDQEILDEAVESVYSTYSFYFQNVWETISEDGQFILKHLVDGPSDLNNVDYIAKSLDDLLNNHVICKQKDKYCIEIPLIKDWIKQQIHTPLS